MVEKVEDAEMTCKACGSDLICHMSKYEGGFENHLQWQNQDGTAHYKWKSSGKFDCVLPKDQQVDVEQAENEASKIPLIPKTTSLDEDMKYVKNKVDLMFAMVSEQFRDYTDRKIHI